MTDAWELVHAERAALAADLEALTDEQWRTPSLCAGWSVHDVAAHLVDNALATPVGVVWAMARARGNFDRQNQQGMERQRGATPRETLSRLREVAPRRSGPPAPVDSRLVEEVLHGEDIRRPLGIWHDYSAEGVERALRYQARVSEGLGGARQRAERVTLHATDLDVTIGDGPQVRGSALNLLMAISGRDAALKDLEGPGVDLLR
ncbi:maleylpyruvate isomerase family mycothiol-dependent enzyme [Janibacter anophelis]|uniref:maleylpyruvate isomerase family mycothiol-dependent enzyme n=1 Tax=Janibacter anophelis TaxID=319054 RepID=UPI00082FAD7D|nr:maleylpyruvate isomerase family mycothiol-dependent enzyme [Janibacter anophelis]